MPHPRVPRAVCGQRNGFEQLLINYANDKLQLYFTDIAIAGLTKFYADEIPWRLRKGTDLTSVDGPVRAALLLTEGEEGGAVYNLIDRLNDSALAQAIERPVVDRATGLLPPDKRFVEDLHSYFTGAKPKAGADAPARRAFVQKDGSAWNGASEYRPRKEDVNATEWRLRKQLRETRCHFAISHFGALVPYNAYGWVDTNFDRLDKELVAPLEADRAATDPIASLFKALWQPSATKDRSISEKFRKEGACARPPHARRLERSAGHSGRVPCRFGSATPSPPTPPSRLLRPLCSCSAVSVRARARSLTRLPRRARPACAQLTARQPQGMLGSLHPMHQAERGARRMRTAAPMLTRLSGAPLAHARPISPRILLLPFRRSPQPPPFGTTRALAMAVAHQPHPPPSSRHPYTPRPPHQARAPRVHSSLPPLVCVRWSWPSRRSADKGGVDVCARGGVDAASGVRRARGGAGQPHRLPGPPHVRRLHAQVPPGGLARAAREARRRG